MALVNFAARALRKAARVIDPPEKQKAVDPPEQQKEIDDTFIKWLRFANAGMLHSGNIYLMDYAIRNLPSDAPILEIGSFCGLSTNVLTHLKRKHGRKNRLITCDKWEFENDCTEPNIPGSPVLFSTYRDLVQQTYIRNIRTFSPDDLPFTIEMVADEFFEAWAERQSAKDVLSRQIDLGGMFSFCYIDGNHTYEQSKRDYLHCDLNLEPGGFVLFDDSNTPSFGVSKLMPEIIASPKYKVIDSRPNYLFQKMAS